MSSVRSMRRARARLFQAGVVAGVAGAAMVGPFAGHAAADSGYSEWVTVPAASTGTTTAASLLAGTEYELVVSGMFRYSEGVADAECTEFWHTGIMRRSRSGPSFDLLVNGMDVEWVTPTGSECDPNHSYRLFFSPTFDAPLDLRVDGGDEQAGLHGAIDVLVREIRDAVTPEEQPSEPEPQPAPEPSEPEPQPEPSEPEPAPSEPAPSEPSTGHHPPQPPQAEPPRSGRPTTARPAPSVRSSSAPPPPGAQATAGPTDSAESERRLRELFMPETPGPEETSEGDRATVELAISPAEQVKAQGPGLLLAATAVALLAATGTATPMLRRRVRSSTVAVGQVLAARSATAVVTLVEPAKPESPLERSILDVR